MKLLDGYKTIAVFVGDLIILTFSLWLALFLRYQSLPNKNLLVEHLIPFSFIFIIWCFVFFIYDLYGKQTLLSIGKQIRAIVNAQFINIVIIITFFYFVPFFNITPKTNLFIFIFVSFFFLWIWRRYLILGFLTPISEKILFACAGPEVDELVSFFKQHPQYGQVVNSDLNQNVSMIVFNAHDYKNQTMISNFYQLIFSGVKFSNIEDLYEEIFGRIPVSTISERWFLENISNQPKPFYDFFKRWMDILVGLLAGIISLVVYPFIILLIKLDDGGSVFTKQTRVGKNGNLINLIKFRTMSFNDQGNWGTEKKNKVTRVGYWLRRTRLDELPQLWNVFVGDVSLIGPRPEFPKPVEAYAESIPFYNIRHIITPGLSGWAQLYHENHPHHDLDILETKNKLSYDLYYIKNRSWWLDVKIALKTIAILLSVKGS